MRDRKVTTKMISLMSKESLKASRMRNIFVMITIVLASALLTAILMFAVGQSQRTKNALSHRQQVSYYNLTDEQVEALKKDDRIAYQIQIKTGILSEMDGFDIMPYYVSEMTDQILVAELESGTLPAEKDQIALQAAVLKKLGVTPAVGSKVTFTFYNKITETFTVSGILKGGDTAKQFSVFFSKDYAENGSQLKNMPYEVQAKLYHAANMYPEECKEAMYLIGSDAGMERKYINPSKSFLDSLSIDMQSVMIYGLVGMVILLACILVIYGVFYLSVIGRIHQFGQLRTIGMTRKQMKKLVSREGGMLFWRSAPIGIVIGGIAGYFMISDGFTILNTLWIIALVFIIIYSITMISVHKPARFAAAVSPMEALRYVPQDTMKKAANRKMCRSLTPIGLGAMNFSKNRKKAVITMLSLGLGGILFMTAATYMSSFDKANYARQGYFTDAEFDIQYAVSAIELNENGISGLQAQAPLDDDMIAKILALDGVKNVYEVKGLGVKFDCPKHEEFNTEDRINSIAERGGEDLEKYLEEGEADFAKLLSGDYVLISGNSTVQEIYGWKFAVGDAVTFHYYDGVKRAEKQVTILGILNQQYEIDHKNTEGWFLMPEQAISNLVSHNSLNTNLIVSTEAEKESAVGESLTRMIEKRPELDMETLEERRISYEQAANQMFGAISGLAIFIMMFSILSMMNTLITNIVTRKQELAMLESIGMDKRQIQKMILGESLLLVFVAVGVTMTIGTFCGYLLSNALYQIGAFYMAFRFPALFACAYAGVLIVVPLAITFLSLHSFSKESLVERLRGAEN